MDKEVVEEEYTVVDRPVKVELPVDKSNKPADLEPVEKNLQVLDTWSRV
jgi:hypothetical protein